MKNLVFVFLVLTVPCWAQEVGKIPKTTPSCFALKGATVVVGDGRVLSNTTVILRDGLIESIGEDIVIPASAWEIDVAGKYLYPGLIDCLSELGVPKPAASRPSRGAPPAEPADREPDSPLMAYVRAADIFSPSSQEIQDWRNAGVLSLNVSPAIGIFKGQTAVVNLNGGPSGAAVVRSPAAARVVLQALSNRQYPASLMGAVAFFRQTLLDARHNEAALRLYDQGPQGLRRPEMGRGWEALWPVVRGKAPLILEAKREREILRAAELGAELGIRVIVAGGHEADELQAAQLRDLPVLISLNLPSKPADLHPEAEESLDAIRHRYRALRSAANLEKLGVPLGFYSDGGNAADFVPNIRRLVKAGMSPEAALQACTLSAARILGVDRQLGSIEEGKIANLVVADRDLLNEEARITTVFVDGEIYELPPPAGREGNKEVVKNRVREGLPEWKPDPRYPEVESHVETLIRNGTVMTVAKGTLRNADVLLRDGKIVEVGPNLSAGPAARVIDASGKWITPGIVDCHNHIASDAVNEASVAVSSMTGIQDVLNPADINIYRNLAGGVTTAQVLHGSANPIGGKNAVIKLRWGKPAQELLLQGAKPGLKFALGENPKRGGASTSGAFQRYPASRMGVEDVIRSAFLEAREYKRQWEDYQNRKQEVASAPIPPRRDLRLEPLVEVLEGKRLMHVHSYRSDEILMVMRLAEDFGVRIATLDHGLDAYKVAKEVARHGAGVTTFSDWWAYKMEAYDAIPHNAALLTRAGVVVSVNSDGPEEARHLNQEAAKCMRYGGLTEDEALALITLNPARQLGIDHLVGSLEPGKDADLVVYNQHPLSVYAVPELVFIDGDLYFSREADRLRQERVEAEKKRLLAWEKTESDKESPETEDPAPRPLPTASFTGQGGDR
jgi:imidazolonepropionase-like amidohydrolase